MVAAARKRPSAPFQRFDEQLQEVLPVVGGPAMCCGPARAAAQRMLRLSGVLRPSGILRPSKVLRPSNDAAAFILQGVLEQLHVRGEHQGNGRATIVLANMSPGSARPRNPVAHRHRCKVLPVFSCFTKGTFSTSPGVLPMGHCAGPLTGPRTGEDYPRHAGQLSTAVGSTTCWESSLI